MNMAPNIYCLGFEHGLTEPETISRIDAYGRLTEAQAEFIDDYLDGFDDAVAGHWVHYDQLGAA